MGPDSVRHCCTLIRGPLRRGALLEHLAPHYPDAAREDFILRTRNGTHPRRANLARDVLKPAC